ncbi:MAG TPA: hypothetical protein QF549_00065 [Candidatus Saccharimonadaceae bacterium]|nr:hypothetical protein [Candidatus Saccharimonadaceae bacterium]|tara:strand:+ start:902 stop:1153 length:252 start_codon:yes stop_codon:yes gene_type:complete
MNRVTINEQVSITQLGFKKNLSTYPRRMEYKGAVYNFIDAGLSCLVRSGEQMAQIITLSDGQSFYRLRSDNHGGNWTLLNIFQ